MSSTDSKQYGLILPKSKQKVVTNVQASKLPKPSVFGNDSSSNSEDDTSTDWMKKRLQSSGKLSETSAGHSGGMKKQAKVNNIGPQYTYFNKVKGTYDFLDELKSILLF